MSGAKSPPVGVFEIILPDGPAFMQEVHVQKDIIKKWGAFPGVGSRTHTHCARAASQALQAGGGLPINSTFSQVDDGGQIFPKTLHKILSHLAGVNQRNKSGEPHAWSVQLRHGCLSPLVPLAPAKVPKR